MRESVRALVRWHINRILRVFNLRIDTLAAENLMTARLASLEQSGHFMRPVFPIMKIFDSACGSWVWQALCRYKSRFDDFEDPSRNDVGYTFQNDYFSSPDAEVLYAVVREFQPKLVVEVGSGYSTRITRQAIRDGQLSTRLISIDPEPRIEVKSFADEIYRMPVQGLIGEGLFGSLGSGDILFIDSSHMAEIGSDVVFLYLILLPSLPAGVLVHVHDIFLPYDYPKEWVLPAPQQWNKPYLMRSVLNESAERVMTMKRRWNEQYLIQALLMCTESFEVVWAGHFLQHSRSDFAQYFRHLKGRWAGSLWLRKRA